MERGPEEKRTLPNGTLARLAVKRGLRGRLGRGVLLLTGWRMARGNPSDVGVLSARCFTELVERAANPDLWDSLDLEEILVLWDHPPLRDEVYRPPGSGPDRRSWERASGDERDDEPPGPLQRQGRPPPPPNDRCARRHRPVDHGEDD